jgi:hypothetical protein
MSSPEGALTSSPSTSAEDAARGHLTRCVCARPVLPRMCYSPRRTLPQAGLLQNGKVGPVQKA